MVLRQGASEGKTRSKTPARDQQAESPEFREVSGRKIFLAFLLGMACLGVAVTLGKSYTFIALSMAFSALATLLWGKYPRLWSYLVSISASTPFGIGKWQFTCNTIYAVWLVALNTRILGRLPRWLYLLTGLALFGFALSSATWMSAQGFLRQSVFFFNFVICPFLLIPVAYCRLEKSRDTEANLRGMLYGLIFPTSLLLFSARMVGRVINDWEASRHVGGSEGGFLMYQLGHAYVNFLRTEVGFPLAALICASAAIAFSEVRPRYKLMAGACLASNLFLLLVTASFGSSLACLCGLAAIFLALMGRVNPAKVFGSIFALFGLLVLTYTFSSPQLKMYLDHRFEHHVVNKDTDRVALWQNGIRFYFENPTGIGFTLSANQVPVHNDYIAYTISYSVFGGMAYAALVWGALFSFHRKRRSMRDDPAALAVFLAGHGAVIVIALNSITDHMTENRWYFNLIWSLVWYSYFCSRSDQGETAAAPVPLRPGFLRLHQRAQLASCRQTAVPNREELTHERLG